MAATEPDLLIVSPCSFSVERTRRELRSPSIREGIERATPRLGAFVADEAYFSRPGPRLADGVDLVRHLLRPSDWQAPMPYGRLAASAEEVAT